MFVGQQMSTLHYLTTTLLLLWLKQITSSQNLSISQTEPDRDAPIPPLLLALILEPCLCGIRVNTDTYWSANWTLSP